MPSQVILEHYAAFSPLGALPQTIDALFSGARGIAAGPCFGVPVAFAAFPDERFRDLRFAASRLGAGAQGSGPLLFCCAKGDIRMLEDHVAGRPLSTTVSPLLDEQARCVAEVLGAGFSRQTSVSTACASGAVAVEMACEMLLDGDAQNVTLFGLDTLSQFVVTGFHALNALSPQGARPFDATRDGLTPGECAAFAVLTVREARPGDIIIAGAGSSNDANHRTGPSRTGDGLRRAAEAALQDARVSPEEIGAVKCHGTGTAYNDAMEAKALAALFGSRIPPCVSVKGALGHTSGAGSLLEILIAAECLRRRALPPTAGFQIPGVEEAIPISAQPQGFSTPSILCLSAGFGGINAAVVIREAA